MSKTNINIVWLFGLIISVFMSSCVYTFSNSRQTPLRNMNKIAVVMFSNETVRPRIESICTAVLRQKIAHSGRFLLVDVEHADVVVKGNIGGYSHKTATINTLKDSTAKNKAQEASISESLLFVADLSIVNRLNGEIIFRKSLSSAEKSFSVPQKSLDYNTVIDNTIESICDSMMTDFLNSLRLDL